MARSGNHPIRDAVHEVERRLHLSDRPGERQDDNEPEKREPPREPEHPADQPPKEPSKEAERGRELEGGVISIRNGVPPDGP